MTALNWAKAGAQRRTHRRGIESIAGARSPQAAYVEPAPPAAKVRASKLPEPVVIAQFWRNRKGEAVIVQLREFEGRVIVDARVSFTNGEGRLQPTKKGLAVAVRRLPELAAAFAKALVQARELGLIDGDAP